MLKKIKEEISWKVSLFWKCLVMDWKNWKLERKISRERKKTQKLKEELQEIIGEAVF